MNIPVDVYTITEPADLAQDWRLFKVRPVGEDNVFGHQFLLPLNWNTQVLKAEQLQKLDPSEMTPVSHFRTSSDLFPRFEVTVTRWPCDVETQDFLELMMWQHGMKAVKTRHVLINDLDVWDGIFETEGEDAKGIRMMVFKCNNLLFRVWGIANKPAFNEIMGDIFAIATGSFQMAKPESSDVIGELLDLKTPFGLTMQHPDCWQAEVRDIKRPDMDAVDLSLQDQEKRTLSYHRVKLLERQRYEREGERALADRAIDEWREAGLSKVKFGENGKFDQYDHKGQWFSVTGTMNGANVVFWITVLQGKNKLAVLSTYAPDKMDNRIAWMAAKRMHHLCLKTINWE